MKVTLIIRVLDAEKREAFYLAREMDVSFTPHIGMRIIHGPGQEDGYLIEEATWDEVSRQFHIVLEDDNITGVLDYPIQEYLESTYLKQGWSICKGHFAGRP